MKIWVGTSPLYFILKKVEITNFNVVLLQYEREFRPHRGKSWRTQETLFNYQKVYLRLPLVGSRWKKEKEFGNWDDCDS